MITRCRSDDNERAHRCCHLMNQVENIEDVPDIHYTYNWLGEASRKNCPFPGGSGPYSFPWGSGPLPLVHGSLGSPKR